jgi:tetratricopeptide (TPR) repeat protein
VRLSTLWWQDMDPRDQRMCQAPDLSTELTMADYRAGRDPALEAILSYKQAPSVVELVRAAAEKNDYAAARVAVQNFIKNPLHKYATMGADINRLGYELINAKRLDQAILVFKLNVETYPGSFNTWDSLGEAYMDRGDKELAIQNYSKSLELNPKNYGAQAQIARLRAH